MDYLASPYFDAQTMMGTLPITHYINEALNDHVSGKLRIKPNTGPKPLHANFCKLNKNEKKVLVLGATGLLGTSLERVFKK